MFERFTNGSRRVVVLAQEEARLLNHNYIGTEHILLGLLHDGENVAARALESLEISLAAVRAQVEEIIGRGGSAPSGHIPFTPRAKKVLELSLREAMQLGHNYIGTEHILLGLIREGEGVAAQALVKLGADLSRVRQQVIQLVAGVRTDDLIPGQPIGSSGIEWMAGSFGVVAVHSSSESQCSFCRRDLSRVQHYATGIDAAICDECITAANAAVATAGDEQVIVFPLPDDPEASGVEPPPDE